MTQADLKTYRVPQLEAGQRPGSFGLFNSHSTEDLRVALEQWHSQRVLLVHSKSLAANTTKITEFKELLGSRLVSTKSGVGAHSPYPDVIDIAHKITENDVDCVVCVGSGSYSDACKTARLLSATLPSGFGETDMEALITQVGIAPESAMKKNEKVKLVLIPTSLSAGEWNFAASCTNQQGKKQHFALQDGCAPDLILMDPWLAALSPERLWLSSGVRAVDHCIEMLCNAKCAEHPDVQEWCEQALSDLSKGLVEYKEGIQAGDAGRAELIDGVSKCQQGSRMALMGFMIYRITMGPSHAIGHQLGSVAGVMHGITSCIMLPHVLRYTKNDNPDAQARILKVFKDSLGWQEKEAGDCVARLVKLLGLPDSLESVGVDEEAQIEKIIDNTMKDALYAFGKGLGREDIAKIVYSAR